MRAWPVLVALLVVACGSQAQGGLVLDGLSAVDDECVVSPSDPLLAEGVLDTSALAAARRPDVPGYFAVLQLRNYEPSRSRIHTGIEGIVLNRAEVEILRDGARATLPGLSNPYLVPAAGQIRVASTTGEPGRDVGFANLVPEPYASALAGMEERVELRISVVGTTDAGSVRTSTAVSFPLRICDGCLVSCGTAASGNTCLVGQDAPSVVVCE